VRRTSPPWVMEESTGQVEPQGFSPFGGVGEGWSRGREVPWDNSNLARARLFKAFSCEGSWERASSQSWMAERTSPSR
jgi:hypothetical protein